jgi:poly(glycerol-phosphate) alpha-glucosyltransferase
LLQTDCDLVHQHGIWQFISVAALHWQRKVKRPHLISPRGHLDTWALQHSRWKKRMAQVIFENQHLRNADCLHALCDAEAIAMRDYGLRNAICVIPNGVDLPEEGSRVTGPEAHFEPLAQSRKVLLYLGRIHVQKGIVNLLRAWAKVHRTEAKADTREWVLAIAGWDQGGHEEEIKSLACELGLTFSDVRSQKPEFGSLSSVIFLGPLFGAQKAACLRACHAFILPSFSEGLPIAVLEAWSYGKPVLMTPECHLPEGFAANAAIRIETNVQSIVQGLEQLVRSESSDLSALGINGRSLICERFTWPKIATDMRSVYEWMVGVRSIPSFVRVN